MKQFLVLTLICSLFFSCKKDSDSSPSEFNNFMKLSVQGDEVNLAMVTSTKSSNINGKAVTVGGGFGSNMFKLTVINPNGEITTGNYPSTATNAEMEILSYIGGSNYITFSSALGTHPSHPLQINISSYDGEIIKGSFSGSVKNDADSTIIITNGVFESKITP